MEIQHHIEQPQLSSYRHRPGASLPPPDRVVANSAPSAVQYCCAVHIICFPDNAMQMYGNYVALVSNQKEETHKYFTILDRYVLMLVQQCPGWMAAVVGYLQAAKFKADNSTTP